MVKAKIAQGIAQKKNTPLIVFTMYTSKDATALGEYCRIDGSPVLQAITVQNRGEGGRGHSKRAANPSVIHSHGHIEPLQEGAEDDRDQQTNEVGSRPN